MRLTIKETFLEKLRLAKFAFTDEEVKNFDQFLKTLEDDRDEVFKAMYGHNPIKNRGTRPMAEWKYRLMEAEHDKRNHNITSTMDYIFTQIKIGMIKIESQKI